MGTIQIDGSTPKLTIGNATAEDATILFDGNAQDFYIALDDSADDLLIGLGSTVGTTPIIAIDENKLSTFSGAITVGVDDTGHDVKFFGATAGSFALWDESADALLLTDSTPIQIGDAQDLTLYHDGTNSYITNKTGALKIATETSGIAITIGHTTSEITVADNLTITGTTVGTSFDLNGTADGLILDADADTTISSPTDDQIDIEISGADDFKFTANTFTAISGSDVVSADYGSYRNRPNATPLIYNGDMQVSQRNVSETGITDNRYAACDRYKIEIDSCGTWTVIQESLTSGNAYDAGFRKALRLDCTTADASPGSADAVIISHRLEGQDLNVFKKGTSNAETYTLAFWIKSNKTGTAQVNFTDQENTRMCSGQYSISSGDTWEHKIINIAADTTGASNNDNTEFIRLSWFFDAGSNYTSGAVPTAWESTAATDKSVSDFAIADHTDNDIAITGVQLEVGTYTSATLPSFQFESYDRNLARCQRYFVMVADGSKASEGVISMGYCHNTDGNYFGSATTPTTLRIGNPAMDGIDASGYWKAYRNNGADLFDNINMYGQGGLTNWSITCDTNISATVGHGCQLRLNNSAAYFALDAEL